MTPDIAALREKLAEALFVCVGIGNNSTEAGHVIDVLHDYIIAVMEARVKLKAVDE